MSATPQARLWIGPSGWSYDDWFGVVYPKPPPRGFKPLAFIATLFNAVEVNTSFYRIPSPRLTEPWLRQTPADFRFAFKLTNVFTHKRDHFPPPAAAAEFIAATELIRDAGRLGPLLIQFPWSFRFSPVSVDWLRRLADTFADFNRSIEVRHVSWTAASALDALRAVGGYCNIDQPPLHDCIGPTSHVFGPTAYVRLHGRNAANWFAEGIPPYERYNYLYDEPALREWADRIEAMRKNAADVFVFANNHYNGQGVVNALELRAMLEKKKVPAPDQLVQAYPRLIPIAGPPADREPRLF